MTEPDVFFFDGMAVACRGSETIATALDRAGIRVLGAGQGDSAGRYFCGIGTCQACVISVDGVRVEACLTTARAGMNVTSLVRVMS